MALYYGLLSGSNAVVDKINTADTTKNNSLTSLNTALTAYSTARTALTTKTQQYFAQQAVSVGQVNSNVYITPDASPAALLTNDMGCYSVGSLVGLTLQQDMVAGVPVDINPCKLRAYDLGYTSFLLDGSGRCQVGSNVGTSTATTVPSYNVSFSFPTLPGATAARILPNGRLAVYNKTTDPSWNTVKQYPDPATPVHNSVSMCTRNYVADCSGFTLTLLDDGTLTMKRLNTIIWQTPPLGDVGISNPNFAKEKGILTTNTLTDSQVLESGNFIGSPTGTCYLYMNATNGGLELRYQKMPACPATVPVGSAALYNFKKETVGRNKMLGQIGYVDQTGTIHAYPPEMTTYPLAPTYKLVGGYNITNPPIVSTAATTAATTDNACAAACTYAGSTCAGYVFGLLNPNSVNVRYVRITNLPGQANEIQISQLLVLVGDTNVALNKAVTASDPYVQSDILRTPGDNTPGDKNYSIDGTASNRAYPFIYHSNPDTNAFWNLDLGGTFPVTKITYYNRAGVHGDRAKKMQMVLMDSSNQQIGDTFYFTGELVQTFSFYPQCRLFTADNMYPNATRTPSIAYKLNVKKKILDLTKIDSTCKDRGLATELGSGLAAPYTIGVPMTADAPCGLPGFTRTEQAALTAADTGVIGATSSLPNLTSMRDTLRSKLDVAARSIMETLAKITAVLSSKGLIGSSAVTIGGELEDAELNMRSNQYKNWLWALLAVVVVLMCWWLQSTPAAAN